MEVSTQRMLVYLALLAAVTGFALVAVAVRVYMKLDIPGVRDDLSGRARQRAMAEQRVHAAALAAAPHPTLAMREIHHDASDEIATQVSNAVISDATQISTPTFTLTRDLCCVHTDTVITTGEVG